MSKLPEEVKEKNFFYALPLPAIPTDCTRPWFNVIMLKDHGLHLYLLGKTHNVEGPWFAPVPVIMLKDMCKEAGIVGHKTNHSLRATGASELFEAGVPEDYQGMNKTLFPRSTSYLRAHYFHATSSSFCYLRIKKQNNITTGYVYTFSCISSYCFSFMYTHVQQYLP